MRLAEGLVFIPKSAWGVKSSETRKTIAGAWRRVNGQRGFVDLARPALLKTPPAFDRLEQRHVVGILDIHPDRNAIRNPRDPRSERFQLVR